VKKGRVADELLVGNFYTEKAHKSEEGRQQELVLAFTSRKTDLYDLFIRMSYFDHKSKIVTKMKRMKGPQVSRQRYRAAL
jgi:hypothetical protein